MRTWKWWALNLAHNWVAHPLLPVADVVGGRVATWIDRLHDATVYGP